MGRVTSVASFGRSGVSDWVIQRISAVVIAAYFLFLVGFFLSHPHLTYPEWVGLYSCIWMKIFSTIALLMLLAHIWIGIWVVLTDYVTSRLMGSKANLIRFALEFLVLATVLIVLVSGLAIFWSV